MQPDRDPSTDAGRHLVVALISVVRKLKARSQDRVEPASVFLLQQVLTQPLLRVSDLAGCVGLDTSTVSRHVRQLETAGYLARSGDPIDRRASRLRVTESGRALLAEAMEARAAHVAEATASWSAADRQALTDLVTRLADSLDASESGPVSAVTLAPGA
jgi:DNA-binding MarR family transcriptional regulator